MRPLAVLALALLAVAVLAGTGSARPQKGCALRRGPGDTLVHSADFQVVNISCEVGWRVALACVRFTYGHAGNCDAAGYRWRCTSARLGLGSTQRCLAGRRSMQIVWLD